MKYISDEQHKALAKNLEEIAKEIKTSENGVQNVKFFIDTIVLSFGKDEAVDNGMVEIDDRTGEYFVSLGSWSAVTTEARKNIQAKRFAEARSAVGYAVRTFTMINNFFKQF